MTADVVAPAYLPRPAEGRYRRVLAALRATARRGLRFRLRCLIMGHEDAFARRPHRLMLRCAACGRETVGWAIGPAAPTAGVATCHATPFSRLAAVVPGPRVRPWGPGPWRARADARDRQRLRMVQAAGRAAERRSDDDYSRTADGSAPASPVKPQVRWVPSQKGLRDDWPQRHNATGRRSIM